MPGDPHTPGRSYGSHRTRRSRASLSARLTMAVVLGVVLVGTGIAVATGAVRMPLSDSAQTPEAATLAPVLNMSAPSANGNGYALATVPVGMLPHATASKTTKPKPHPTTASPTPSTAQSSTAQSRSAASNLLTPRATAQNETPTGQNQLAWSEGILTALGAPLTSANLTSIGYWMQNEAGSPPSGIVGANNPINVSEAGYNSTPIQNEGQGYYLESYDTVADGLAATAAYLNNGSYGQIVADLKAGVGLTGSDVASELQVYSGNGYSTIPDSWGASQGTPTTS
jgi:hypothetical protein